MPRADLKLAPLTAGEELVLRTYAKLTGELNRTVALASVWSAVKASPEYSKMTDFKLAQLIEFYASGRLAVHLNLRGLLLKLDNYAASLTAEQLAAALVFVDHHDTRSLATKLREIGVTRYQYNGWLRDQTFRSYIHQLAENALRNSLHEAHTALLRKVNRGDMNALKLYYAMIDRYRERAQIDVNLEVVLVRLVEAIGSVVTNADERAALAERIGTIGSDVLNNSPELTSSPALIPLDDGDAELNSALAAVPTAAAAKQRAAVKGAVGAFDFEFGGFE